MIILIIGIIVAIIAPFFLLGWQLSAPTYSGPKSDHFNGSTFINPKNIKAKGLLSVFKWIIKRDQGPWTKNYETFVGEKPTPHSTGLQITFVNHSTFLIQWKGLNILTDPMWSERCSPFNFAGPRRMRPPGLNFEDLPHIDIVLLSHNHYDHLDITTVKEIEKKHQPLFVVPLGVRSFLIKHEIKNIVELDWWEKTHNGLNIQAIPAQHFSSRGMFDRDKTLWCGYLLESEKQKIYFVGDTGYGDFIKQIGKKIAPVDVSLIPIGAYLPKWFMAPIHVSPDESVQIHKDVKSQQSIAMHFGTFPLADDGQGKAEEDLILALEKGKVDQKYFSIPEEGIPISFDENLKRI